MYHKVHGICKVKRKYPLLHFREIEWEPMFQRMVANKNNVKFTFKCNTVLDNAANAAYVRENDRLCSKITKKNYIE